MNTKKIAALFLASAISTAPFASDSERDPEKGWTMMQQDFKSVAEKTGLTVVDKFTAYPGLYGFVVHPKQAPKKSFVLFSDDKNFLILDGKVLGFDGGDPLEAYLSSHVLNGSPELKKIMADRNKLNIDDSELLRILEAEYAKEDSMLFSSDYNDKSKKRLYVFAEMACYSCKSFFKAIERTTLLDTTEIVYVPMLFLDKSTALKLTEVIKLPREERFQEVLNIYNGVSKINDKVKGLELKDTGPKVVDWLNKMGGIAQKYSIKGTPSFLWKNTETGKIYFRIESMTKEEASYFEDTKISK